MSLSPGTVLRHYDVTFSLDETVLFEADGMNQKVWMLRRNDLEIIGATGRRGRQAGQFHRIYSIASDSQGNLYTAEVDTGRRVQKFMIQQ